VLPSTVAGPCGASFGVPVLRSTVTIVGSRHPIFERGHPVQRRFVADLIV